MSNLLYDKGRQKFLDGTVSWLRDTIKVVLVDSQEYTFSATHEFLSDVPVGGRVATSSALTAKTATSGVADAADVTLTSVTGDQSEYLVIYAEWPTATGTGDSVDTPDGAGVQTLTDAAGLFTSGMERGYLKITGATGGNNGSFYIVKYNSATSIDYYNPAGASETVGLTWSIESPLIAFIDTATGLAVTPNGGNIIITWDNGANKIFKL